MTTTNPTPTQQETLRPPERIRVVVRAATSDDWIGVAYCKNYTGDPSTIHEYSRAADAGPQGDAACPCLHTEPCQKYCTCVNHHSSHGCDFCCSYGSEEQQRVRAEHLRKLILLGIEAERAATSSPTPAERKREFFDAGFSAEGTRVEGEQRLLTPEELADIQRFQKQRRKSPVATDAWLYVAEIDRLLAHIRLGREQLENEIFQDATDPNFAAAPADNDALEVCRLLTTLDWIVGYELAGENQTILDRAQELALKVMGMSDLPTTKGDR